MLLKSVGAILFIVQFTSFSLAIEADQPPISDNESARIIRGHDDKHKPTSLNQERPVVVAASLNQPTTLEARISDRNFVKDIVDRLHALDADIGKLLYNSTSMYAPNDQDIAQQDGGERFTEVLNDLDALQDEIGVLVNNATRTRQYNILIRLRPLNNILYRIRHNLHLMRNSLVAINAVSGLEKIGNSVLDSTLQAFMKPDANLSEEIGDDGNYDINLDKHESVNNSTSMTSTTTTIIPSPPSSISPSSPVAASTTSTTSTTTTTTPPPSSSTAKQASTERQVSTSQPTRRPATRRANHRQGQRRTQRPTTSKPDSRNEVNSA